MLTRDATLWISRTSPDAPWTAQRLGYFDAYRIPVPTTEEFDPDDFPLTSSDDQAAAELDLLLTALPGNSPVPAANRARLFAQIGIEDEALHILMGRALDRLTIEIADKRFLHLNFSWFHALILGNVEWETPALLWNTVRPRRLLDLNMLSTSGGQALLARNGEHLGEAFSTLMTRTHFVPTHSPPRVREVREAINDFIRAVGVDDQLEGRLMRVPNTHQSVLAWADERLAASIIRPTREPTREIIDLQLP